MISAPLRLKTLFAALLEAVFVETIRSRILCRSASFSHRYVLDREMEWIQRSSVPPRVIGLCRKIPTREEVHRLSNTGAQVRRYRIVCWLITAWGCAS